MCLDHVGGWKSAAFFAASSSVFPNICSNDFLHSFFFLLPSVTCTHVSAHAFIHIPAGGGGGKSHSKGLLNVQRCREELPREQLTCLFSPWCLCGEAARSLNQGMTYWKSISPTSPPHHHVVRSRNSDRLATIASRSSVALLKFFLPCEECWSVSEGCRKSPFFVQLSEISDSQTAKTLLFFLTRSVSKTHTIVPAWGLTEPALVIISACLEWFGEWSQSERSHLRVPPRSSNSSRLFQAGMINEIVRPSQGRMSCGRGRQRLFSAAALSSDEMKLLQQRMSEKETPGELREQ